MQAKLFQLAQFLKNSDDAFHFSRVIIHFKEELSFHYHDYAEIFWIDRGEGIHYINGVEHPVCPGVLYMIRPNDKHTFSANSKGGIRISNIAFFTNTLIHLQNRYFANSNDFFWSTGSLPFSIKLSAENCQKLELLSDRMISEARNTMNLDLFLIRIFQIVQSEIKIQSLPDKVPAWLFLTMEKFNNPFYFKQGIKGFTTLTKKTVEHTNRMMKKHFYCTLTDYINKKRMEYAATQVIMTSSPIKIICDDCGYQNLGFFYKMFKQVYQMSPIQYRKLNQKIV